MSEAAASNSSSGNDVIDVDNNEDTQSGSGLNNNANPTAAASNSQDSNEPDLPPIGSGVLFSNVSWAYSLNYFRKCDDETSICRLCEQESKKKFKHNIQIHFKTTNFGTSGLKAHFKAKHKQVWEIVAAALQKFEKEEEKRKEDKRKGKSADGTKQLKLFSNNNNQVQIQVVNHCPETQRRWDKAVVNYLCQTFSSFSSCEKHQILLLALYPSGKFKIKIRSRKTISAHVSLQAEALMKDMIKVLTVLKETRGLSGIGMTSDMWSADRIKESYISLTLQLLDDNFEMIRMTPFVSYFGNLSHSGVNIRAKLEEKLRKLQIIDPKIQLYMTMDNASPNKTAMRNMDRVEALWCIIHTAMLCVEDATDIVVCHVEVTKLLKKAHELVVFVRRTENRRCVLKNACQKTNISFSLPARCVETRFNTNAIMLESILKLKPALQYIQTNYNGDDKWDDNILTNREFNVAESLVKSLECIKIATKCWEIETDASIQHAIPQLYNIQEELKKLRIGVNVDAAVIDFAESLSKEFEKPHRFPKCGTNNKFYRLAHLLDPNFRGCVLEEPDINCYAETKADLLEMCKKYEQPEPEEQPTDSADIEDEILPELPTLVSLTGMERLKKRRRINSGAAAGQTQDLSKAEIEFLNYENLSIDSDKISILEWWNQMKSVFPLLSSCAREVLCLPVSSSSSERAFSIGGQVLMPRRCSLKSNKIEDLCIIKINQDRVENYVEKYKMTKEKVDINDVRADNDEEGDILEDEVSMEEVGEPTDTSDSVFNDLLRDL